jgi:signal transduction histidine kinase
VAGAPPPASIEVKAWVDDDRLVLEVIDSGKGKGPKTSGGGIGLSNVRQRLGLIYGQGTTNLSANRLPDGSFHVRVEFPLEAA